MSTVRAMNRPPNRIAKRLLVGFRSAISWIYCLLAVGALFTLPYGMRELAPRFWSIAAASYLFVLPFVFGLAWWTTFRKKPSHKYWVVAASLLNLMALAPILLGAWSSVDSLRFLWALVVIGVVGLAVYLPPYKIFAPAGALPSSPEPQSQA